MNTQDVVAKLVEIERKSSATILKESISIIGKNLNAENIRVEIEKDHENNAENLPKNPNDDHFTKNIGGSIFSTLFVIFNRKGSDEIVTISLCMIILTKMTPIFIN
jgi:hypothetical protein